ncbi:MAG: hypothetical protein ABI414_08805 [Devosia sp.]
MSSAALKARRVQIANPAFESSNFYLVDRIAVAANQAERAALLLAAPDDVVLAKAGALSEVCIEAGFQDGLNFINVRVATLCAKRLPSGELPDALRDQVEYWRNGLAAIAGGRA